MAPWGPGAITKIAWGKVYIPHCGIYHGEQGMNPIRTKSTGKTTGKTHVVYMKAYDIDMNEIPLDRDLPRGRYVVVSVIKREHPTYPYIARFFCVTVSEDGEMYSEMVNQIALQTPDVPTHEIGIAIVNCEP